MLQKMKLEKVMSRNNRGLLLARARGGTVRFKRQSSKTSQPVGPFLGPGGYCCALQYGSVRSNKRPSALLLLPLVTPSFFSYSEQMVRLRAPANVRKSVFL